MSGPDAQPAPIDMTGIKHDRVGYDGSVFGDFYAARDKLTGPGWYVFGRNAEKYGTKPGGEGAYVKLCGRPDRPLIRVKSYNRLVSPGWRTRREASAAAALISAHYAP